MPVSRSLGVLCALLLVFFGGHTEAQDGPWQDPSPHRVSFVTVEHGVRLEVLDWGGTGRPLVLLAGLGLTAHVFDDFAPALARHGHVYGITRRGFGASDAPDHGYSADRLADDVVAVIHDMALVDPVVIGHSIAGQELSSIAARHPGSVAGVVYLDGVSNGFLPSDVQEAIQALPTPSVMPPRPPQPREPELENFAALRSYMARFQGYAPPESELRQMFAAGDDGSVGAYQVDSRIARALSEGGKRYDDIGVPALVVVSSPPARARWTYDLPAADQAAFEEVVRSGQQRAETVASAIEARVPTARVVRIPNADHHVYGSHADLVLREISDFLATLP